MPDGGITLLGVKRARPTMYRRTARTRYLYAASAYIRT